MNQSVEFRVTRHWDGLNTVSEPVAKRESSYAVRHLERFPGTAYPKICERLVELFAQSPISRATLVVDQTGAGRAVVRMIRQACPRVSIRPITITGGQAVVPDGAGWHVPKIELVSLLQVLFQAHRLQVARLLPMAATLVTELETFQGTVTVKPTETIASWRERDHDDLLLAIAVAAWFGEHGRKQFWML
jgi:hypothetical protein